MPSNSGSGGSPGGEASNAGEVKGGAPSGASSNAGEAAQVAEVNAAHVESRGEHERAQATGAREVTLQAFDLRVAGRLGAAFAGVVFVVWVVACMLVWLALQLAGVWGRLNSLLSDVAGLNGITGWGVLGCVLLLGAVQFLVVWAMVPVSAWIYNSVAGLLGGLRVSVAEVEAAEEEPAGEAAASPGMDVSGAEGPEADGSDTDGSDADNPDTEDLAAEADADKEA